ncbi:MAG: enoyl-CoA hydratase/isomerase family protein [Pseudomonadales bacterium]|nr:enoyl-CoA hydratase/isomerase family protein [Pseudomonadales bacterium]
MSDEYETLTITRCNSVVQVYLNRPEARNAMNRQMVRDLLDFFQAIKRDRSVRVVILGAHGPTFCAGGDIKELREDLTIPPEAQMSQVETFDTMLRAVNEAPQVVIARIQGDVMGGGVGLICVADMAVAAADVKIGLPEVRLGLVPALISPYVVARIGLTRAREWMLRGLRVQTEVAAAAGLITIACPANELDQQVTNLVNDVLAAPATALAACKALLFEVASQTADETVGHRVNLLNQLRTSAEGQEGMMAFVQKRSPNWTEKYEPAVVSRQ